jgi:prefoldin subunit 5
MARITLDDLKAEIDARNAEIARLEADIAELREHRAAVASALRIMRSLIEDVMP